MLRIFGLFILLFATSCSSNYAQRMIGKWASSTNSAFVLEITEDDDHYYVSTPGGVKRLAYLDNENKILNVANSYNVSLGEASNFVDITSGDVTQFIYIAKDDNLIMRHQIFTRVPSE